MSAAPGAAPIRAAGRGGLACARALALLTAAAACARPDAGAELRRVDGRVLMGTVLEVDVRGLAPERADQLLAGVFARVAAEDKLFSRFDPQAELVALNAHAGQGWQPVDPALASLVQQSQALSAQTGGTFDVTVGPLVELWTRAGERGTLPDAQSIAAARGRVGFERMRVQTSPAQIALEPGTSLDLGGVAKGFALDQLVADIAGSGATAALLSFGGSSMQALGAPAGQPGWRVLVPDAGEGFAGVITLRDCALSVSSSLGQSVEIAGRHYGHILDPRSGEPVASPRLAAVVSARGTTAEALSKALLLLDASQADGLFERFPDSVGMRLEADGTRWYSKRWKVATRFSPLPGS
jgi:thiamine biosynthesis lipoprotein